MTYEYIERYEGTDLWFWDKVFLQHLRHAEVHGWGTERCIKEAVELADEALLQREKFIQQQYEAE
jgi:hypothetical protein